MSGGILPGFFLEITFSQIGLTVSFLLGIGLLLGLFTKRIRSPAAIVLSVLVLAVIVFQFSLVLWLMFSCGTGLKILQTGPLRRILTKMTPTTTDTRA